MKCHNLHMSFRFKENLPSKAQIDKYFEEWKEIYLDLVQRWGSVFTHYDTNHTNIIYNSKTGERFLCSITCVRISELLYHLYHKMCDVLESFCGAHWLYLVPRYR